MLRFQFVSRSSGGIRCWATGLMLASAGQAFASSAAVAATTATETLDAAVARELAALTDAPAILPTSHAQPAHIATAPRSLPSTDDGMIRQVVAQEDGAPAMLPATTVQQKQPTNAQMEVMRQLEEMYERDGRGPMPSLRLKDAPNTRLPQGMKAVPPSSSASPASQASTIQPASSMEVPPAPVSQGRSTISYPPRTTAEPKKRGMFSWFRRDSKPEPAARPTESEGGLFSRMFRPFRRDTDETASQQPISSTPPVPPPTPAVHSQQYYSTVPAPSPLPSVSARPVTPSPTPSSPAPAVSRPPAAPPAEPPAAPPAAPPADDFSSAPFAAPRFAEFPAETSPVSTHPLADPVDDPFADVREDDFGDASSDFVDAPTMADDDFAPQDEMPASIATDDPFGAIADDDSSVAGPPAQATPQFEDIDQKARYAELQRKLAERAGLGGFQGFCPVSLHDQRALVDGRPEFVAVYEGRTYELSSAEARVRFEAAPEKYAPVQRGSDVVLMSRGESEVEGNLQYAAWFKGRLYMFRSAETLAEFDTDPQRYAIAQ